jgi:hypothetical protein
VKTRATSCSSLLEEPQEQLLLFGTPLDAVRDTVHRSDYQAISEGYDRFGSLARSRPTVEIRDEDCLVEKMLIRVTPLLNTELTSDVFTFY